MRYSWLVQTRYSRQRLSRAGLSLDINQLFCYVGRVFFIQWSSYRCQGVWWRVKALPNLTSRRPRPVVATHSNYLVFQLSEPFTPRNLSFRRQWMRTFFLNLFNWFNPGGVGLLCNRTECFDLTSRDAIVFFALALTKTSRSIAFVGVGKEQKLVKPGRIRELKNPTKDSTEEKCRIS